MSLHLNLAKATLEETWTLENLILARARHEQDPVLARMSNIEFIVHMLRSRVLNASCQPGWRYPVRLL